MNDEIYKKALEMTKIARHIRITESVKKLVELTEKFQVRMPKIDVSDYSRCSDSKLLKSLEEFSRIAERANNSPELQFALISDFEVLNLKSTSELKESLIYNLTDQDIDRKEEVLNKNLMPLLKELKLDALWVGANTVLKNESNPDRLRHCLISLRTILEYLIDAKLAPMDELKNSEMFKDKFKKYHLGKQKIEFVKVKRSEKIEYFTSKFEFGFLEDFTKNEIQYICDCYSVLCKVHKPEIGITENQVKSLKVKTGITIWLLIHLNELLK